MQHTALRVALFTRHQFCRRFFNSTAVMASPKKARLQEAYDLVVIGGGSGGLAVARRARSLGARVCLIDKSLSKLGGTCVNVGCVPKKLFWIEAERQINTSSFVKHDGPQGSNGARDAFNWEQFKKARDGYITRLNGIYAANLAKEGIDIFEGEAKLIDAKTVSITPSTPAVEELSVDSKYIVIATGSHPILPLDIKNHELGITSDGFFQLSLQPRKCAIIGGGYVAAELAGILHAFGADVSLFVRGCCMLGVRFDEMLQEAVMETMQENMQLHLNTKVTGLERDGASIVVHTDQQTTMPGVDCVIWAIGRAANLLDSSIFPLGLTERGYLKVDSDLCCYSSQDKKLDTVFGVGDVTGWHMLTPVAIANGRLLADRLFSPKKNAVEKVDEYLIPSVLFTHPPVGTIGLTESQAVLKHGKDRVKIYNRSFKHMNHAFAEHPVKSKFKLITLNCDAEERVIGVHLYGPGVEEALQGIAIAMQAGATKQQLDRTVAIHPTGIEEILNMQQ